MSSTETTFRFVKTNGITLHIAEAGPVKGPLVLLLHGFPEFWFAWRGQMGLLAAAGFHVVAPDQRGYNLSDKPKGAGQYGLDALTSDIEGLIKALGYSKAFLAGHDWGGIVAWHMALRFPSMVERLCILNVPHPSVMKGHLRTNPKQMVKSWYALFFQIPALPESIIKFANYRFGRNALTQTSRPGTFTALDLKAYTQAWSQPGALTAMIHWYRGFFMAPAAKLSSSMVTTPTLILWGTRDAFLRQEMAQDSMKRCADGKLVLFEKATHWIQHEEPERVAHLLIQHFKSESI